MTRNSAGSFIARWRRKLFRRRVESEVYDRIMSHLQHEADHGYSFSTRQEMRAQTKEIGLQDSLNQIEQCISEMPPGFGQAFRHIMHRELREQIRKFEEVARFHKPRTCDPRFIARRYEPVH